MNSSPRPEDPVAIALDIGSSSIRSMAFDSRGREIAGASSQESYDLDTGVEGQVTLDADSVLERACRCIDFTYEALVSRRPVAAVGVSCFWHSLLGLDARGNPLTPVYHLADSRSADVVDRLRQHFDEAAWKRRTGTVFHSSYWPAKLRWLRETNPADFSEVDQWTSVADYIDYRLLGTNWTSLCMASGTGLCEIASGAWSLELAEIAGVKPETLPEVVDRDRAAYLLPEAEHRWPRLANVPWFPALGDGACANAGCGATNTSRIALTLGTTGALRVLDISPIGRPVAMFPELWTYRLDAQTVIHGAAITNGGIWVDFIRELLLNADGDLLDQAFALEPGAHGLTVLPFLAGERSPIWNDRAQAVIAGVSPRSSRADIMRASLESVAHRLALLYEQIAPVATRGHAVIANGAALLRSPGWQQIIADSLELPIVTLPATVEASARGAAITALQSAGAISSISDVDDLAIESPVVQPDARRAATYRQERKRQEVLRHLLYPGAASWDD